jgi:hypothetical protein
MEFQSRTYRMIFIKAGIGIVPDIVIVLIATWYIGGGPLTALLLFLGLQALFFCSLDY